MVASDAGRQLAVAIARAGLSQQEVARRIGVSRQQLNRYQSGKSVIPDERREAIAQALGVTIGDIWNTPPFFSPPSGLNPATQHQLALDAMELAGRLNDFARGVLQAEPTVQRVEPFAVVPAKPPTVAIPRGHKR